MGRWLPAILLFGLTTLCSCAEEPDNAYPGNTQNKALKAWMTQNRPDLLENYQEEGEYYVDVVSLGDLADSAILETESWVWYDITGRDLQGNISVARDSVYALQQGTFTPYTHYVPYYQFYGELASGTFKEGTYLAMRNPLKLGETYAAQKGFPREVELRVGAEVVLYMPATIISTEANGDGGYEGQYALSANHPMIARIKLVGRSSQPIETESVAVDDFAAAFIRLEGGVHEVSNSFWSYENTYTMQPLHRVNRRYDALTREYLSSIYVDELDSPARSARNWAKQPYPYLTAAEPTERHINHQ